MLRFANTLIQTIKDLDPFVLPLDLLFPGRKIEDLEPLKAALAPHHVDFASGSILLGVQSHLLRIGGLNILVDTCVGEHKPRPRRADWDQRQMTGYLERLRDAGLAPDDIDIVLCTHLHADHVGWNTRLIDGRWIPTFPNARYIVGREEFDHWMELENRSPGTHNHGAFADSVLPIRDAGQIELVDDGFELASGLNLMALPGHSPGQMGLCLCHGEQRAIFCADAIHSPVQVYHPDWASRFCSDPDQAVRTRQNLLKDVAERGDILLPAHLRHYPAMRVSRVGEGYHPDYVPP